MNKWIRAFPVILAVILLGFFGYRFFSKWHQKEVEIAVEQKQAEWQEEEQKLKEKIVTLEADRSQLDEEVIDTEKLTAVFGETPPETTVAQKGYSCQQAEERIISFFNYLDGRAYIQAHNLEKGTYHEFLQMTALLSANPPRVSGETQDLVSIMHNVSHFYRTLKKDRMQLLKEIIENETALCESIMEAFYYWSLADGACSTGTKNRLSMESAYYYSGFFLNTLGGKSYLSRRGAKVRALTRYYSILSLDRANDEMLNSDGIDIRPHIRQLYQDLRYQRGLSRKAEYLSQLENLMEKYRMM